MLVTTTEYNSRGEAYKTIDPAGREDRQEFDVESPWSLSEERGTRNEERGTMNEER